ncbi:MAG: DUF1385 domain-containing protein [Armatimonadetes bacterium]|nr:DUF1385 domain-containing protein [Anaerolineae bacterium]
MSDQKYDVLAQPKNEMKFSYGGQAVIDGVMMRGAHIFAVAVRAPDGSIVVHEGKLNKTLYRGRIAKLPLIRGIVGLWDSLGLGTRALMWSADIALQEPTPAIPVHDVPADAVLVPGMVAVPAAGKAIDFNGPIGWATVSVSLLIGLGLFLVLPNAAATFVASLIGVTSLLTINIIEGVIQLGILIGYMWLIGLMPDTRRLFGYHGAEHKTINAYEAGAELTPESVAQFPIEHPRCGTAFLLTVAFIGMFSFAIIDTVLGRSLITRIVFIPLIAGISYEVLRYTAKNIDKPLIRLLITPNLALQHLTTRPPDLTMNEVAIVAFKRVLASEGIISPEEATIPAPRPPQVAVPVPAVAGD